MNIYIYIYIYMGRRNGRQAPKSAAPLVGAQACEIFLHVLFILLFCMYKGSTICTICKIWKNCTMCTLCLPPPNPPTGPADCHQPLPSELFFNASVLRPRFLLIFLPFWAPFGRPRWSQNRKITEKMGVQIRSSFCIAFLLNFCSLLNRPNLEKS